MSELKKEKKTKKTTVSETKKETKVKTTKKKVEKENCLLTRKDQKTYKTLCKVTRVLAKICRVLLMIFVPFIVLSMFLVPIIFSKFEISGNVLKFDDASIIIRDTGLSFKLGDHVKVFDCNTTELDRITTYLTNHSKGSIIFAAELSLILLVGICVLDIYILMNLEDIISRSLSDKTPFTKENTDSILKIAKYLVAAKVIVIIMSFTGLFNGSVVSVSIIEILVVYILYYVFKYATSVQKMVETKICN